MKAVWLEDKTLSVRELPRPTPDGREALVRVRLAGICGTDLELARGYYPYRGVIGHEFVGEVSAAPSAPALLGKRVVGEINAVCGTCPACLGGRSTHCENRTVLGIVGRDGAFAEFLLLPIENLHVVPESVPDEVAVFTEPTAAAVEILDQVHIKPEDRVLLVGAGRLGMVIAQTVFLTGCYLEVLIRRDEQRELVEAFGIRAVREEHLSPGTYDVVIEATGLTAGFEIARTAVRPRGTIVLKSTYAGDIQLDLSSIVVDEITLLGSRCGPFEPAIKLLEDRRIDPRALIETEFALDEALDGFELARRRGVLKVLLRPGS